MSRLGKKVRNNLKIKLSLLFFLSSLIPLVFSCFQIYYGTNGLIRKRELDRVQYETALLTDELEKTISSVEQNMSRILLQDRLIEILASEPSTPYENYLRKQSVNDMVASSIPYGNEFISMTILGKNGLSYGDLNVTSFQSYYDPLAQYTVLAGGRRAVAFSRMINEYQQVPVITMGMPIYARGASVGVLIADIRCSSLDKFVQDDSSKMIFVLDQNGDILYRYGDNADVDKYFLRRIRPGEERVTWNGEIYFCVQYRSSNEQYQTIALLPEDVMFQDSFRYLLQNGALLFLILLETILFALFVSNMVSKNIRIMEKAVEQFSVEGIPIPMEISSTDEVGRLSKGLEVMFQRIYRLMDVIKKNQEEKRKLEMRALQAQINPHMIYNTLNTITYLAQVQDVPNIQEVSSSFAYLLRIISSIPGEFLTIRQELDYIQYYVSIKKYNLLYPLELQFDVEEDLMDCRIPKLILQPLVENSIVHGFAELEKTAEIRIGIHEIQQGQLQITILDNGCGIPPDIQQKILRGERFRQLSYDKVGVRNTMERLRLQYGNKMSFHLESDGASYTLFTICIPIERTASDEPDLPSGTK